MKLSKRDEKTKYTSNEEISELRKAICKDLESELGIKYDVDSEVIVSNPYWSNYTDIIRDV